MRVVSYMAHHSSRWSSLSFSWECFFPKFVVLLVLFSLQSLLFLRGSYCFSEVGSRWSLLFEIFSRKLLFSHEATISTRFSRDNHFYFRGFFAKQLLFPRDFLATTASIFAKFLWGSFYFGEDAFSREWRFREDGSTRMTLASACYGMASASTLSRECLFARYLVFLEDLLFFHEICLSRTLPLFAKNLFFFFFARDPFFHEGLAFFALFFLHKWPAREPFFEPVTYFQGRK